MKKSLRLLAAATVLLASTSTSAFAQEITSYGKDFDAQKAISTKLAVTSVQTQNTLENVAVQGVITQVCQTEGCWMKIKNEGGEDIFVKFVDHSFLIPKNLSGRNTIVFGTLSRKTVSVEERRHLAGDAGATKAQINAITTSKEELRIDATGIKVM